MPLEIPSRAEVNQTGQSHIRAELPEASAIAQRRSFISGFTRSFFGAVHDLYRAMKRYADNEPFPQRASETFLARGWWLDITGLTRHQPAPARGSVVITGTAGSIVPTGAELTANGNTYTVDDAVTIVTQTLAGRSSRSLGMTAVFETASPHNLASGVMLTISGAATTALNGTFEILVIDATTFSYEIKDALAESPVESSLVATGAWANAVVTASVAGTQNNIDADSDLSFGTPPTGIDAAVRATFSGVVDGTDLETVESFRERILEALGTDFGMFTADEIELVARQVPGVTRVFVRKPLREHKDGFPLEGQVRIAFLRENDVDPIPSAFEVEQVRQKIHADLVPAHTLDEDVEVLAPERYDLDIHFRSISPDTPGMRVSIRNQVLQFLAEEAEWGGTLEVEALRCAIREGLDADTGQALDRYVLALPTTDIDLPVDAFPVLRNIRWAGT